MLPLLPMLPSESGDFDEPDDELRPKMEATRDRPRGSTEEEREGKRGKPAAPREGEEERWVGVEEGEWDGTGVIDGEVTAAAGAVEEVERVLGMSKGEAGGGRARLG